MTKRMLVDATHPEETRVVVADQDQLVDFDFESSTKTQLKGNVYLAKVTRVEPSLQAAFVEYGGNRHGFLAFSEVHPDYYQIPQADRELLERLEREAIEESRAIENALDPSEAEQPGTGPEGDGQETEAGTDETETAGASPEPEDEPEADEEMGEAPPPPESINEGSEQETDEVMGEQVRRRARLLRSYKIQEVIKRRQILLVQVVKEERGNKGAALTTYLSLAGRYCVLMPNTPRGGGISRKITNVTDRRRLKTIIQGLDVPQGMGLIVRTAGQQRNKSEIKRDYDFLLRQWSEIRDTTLESVAPAMIYQEGNLIKRAMRDLYTRDIDEVLIEGEEGYRTAKKLMQMMMPSHARKVKLYKEGLPLFYRHHIEDQLDGMHSPVVHLPSGGSIVIHTTEALTAVDVNSGRSTRERHIDETALKTNIEAADEVARQLRLRDLAGLVVIDFIDMAEHRHQRQVERRLREALKLDRARLQVGRISMFGLLELSRQRLRASLLELSSQACPVCSGLGVVRSTESCALHALRCVQEEGIKNEAKVLQLSLPTEVALYLLNQKRDSLLRLESRYEMKVLVTIDGDLLPSELQLDVVERRERPDEEGSETADRPERSQRQRGRRGRQRAEREEGDGEERHSSSSRRLAASEDETSEDSGGNSRRRRRRRRRRREDEEDSAPREEVQAAGEEETATGEAVSGGEDSGTQPEEETKRRRRRRRRGRSDREQAAGETQAADTTENHEGESGEETPAPVPPAVQAEELLAKLQKFVAIEPQPPRVPPAEMGEQTPAAAADHVDDATQMDEPAEVHSGETEPLKIVEDSPVRDPEPQLAMAASDGGNEAVSGLAGQAEPQTAEPVTKASEPEIDQPERRGWWSRWVK